MRRLSLFGIFALLLLACGPVGPLRTQIGYSSGGFTVDLYNTIGRLFDNPETSVTEDRLVESLKMYQNNGSAVPDEVRTELRRRGVTGPPTTGQVETVGDPMIVAPDVRYNYRGSAPIVYLDKRGALDTINFVAVHPLDGSVANGDYISEVWRYYVRERRWGYLKVDDPTRSVVVSDHNLKGERPMNRGPGNPWFQQFRQSNVFLVYGDLVAPGPDFPILLGLIDNPHEFKFSADIRRGEPEIQTAAMLLLQGHAKSHGYGYIQRKCNHAAARALAFQVVRVALSLLPMT